MLFPIALLAFLASISFVTVVSAGTCAIINQPPTPTNISSQNFTQTDCFSFSGDSCCNTSQTNAIYYEFTTIVPASFKCQHCINNLKYLWCNYTCNAAQDNFVTVMNVNGSGYVNTSNCQANSSACGTTFNVSSTFATTMWNSCESEVFGGQPFKTAFPTPASFIQFQGVSRGIAVNVVSNTNSTTLNPTSDPKNCVEEPEDEKSSGSMLTVGLAILGVVLTQF